MHQAASEPRRFWLLKTEPSSFSIQDLAALPGQATCWDGVRNYQARNYLRDGMRLGDGALIYHSRAQPLAVVGQAEIVREGFVDPSQFDPTDDHYDPAAAVDAPRWWAVEVRLTCVFRTPVTRQRIRAHPALQDMMVLQQGSRLSVQPVSSAHWRLVCQLGLSD